MTDTRPIVLSGRCALLLEWGDIGPLSIDLTQSKIDGLVASRILPGSRRVVDRRPASSRTARPSFARTRPTASTTPRSPRSALVGSGEREGRPQGHCGRVRLPVVHERAGAVQLRRDAGWTGYNPYRVSQFENIQPWVDAGFSQESAENYLGAIGQSLNSPNMASDLRIPGTQQYEGICLDREIARFLAGEITDEQTMDNIYECWEEVTEDFGRERQAALYRASLGITN